MRHIAQQIHHQVAKAKKVMIIPHQNPDGDAIGSATAFKEYLHLLNKKAVIFCITPVSDKLHFIPNSKEVVQDKEVFNDPHIDTIVVLDSGDLRYAGVDSLVAGHKAIIINIDHHATNEHYGHLNLVIPTAASTTEILFHYFRHNNITINQKIATSLLTGLTTDTGGFTNAATSGTALLVSGELIRSGGNLTRITNATFKNKSVESLRLWGKVLSRLEKDERLNMTYTYITKKDLEECKVSDTESEGIANFLNNLENTNIALILKETPDGKIKGSLRTTLNNVDVSSIAKKLGGGGHKKAAGFTCEGTIEEILKKILTTTP